MRSVLVALLLLSACATAQVPAVPVKSEPLRVAWPQEMRERFVTHCLNTFEERGAPEQLAVPLCSCVQTRLEARQPWHRVMEQRGGDQAEFKAALEAAGKECVDKVIADAGTI